MRQSAVTSKERITVNLEASDYRKLQGLAKRHKVSMAWLGRRAIEAFLRERDGQLEFPFPDAASRPES